MVRELSRGDVVVTVVPGNFGKPRPALIVQSDLFKLPSVVICPFSTTIRDDVDMFRVDVEPTPGNGLLERSQLAVDKITVVPVEKVGQVIGRAGAELMDEVDQRLAFFLGLA